MDIDPWARRAWLSQHVLPYEPELRRQLRYWGLPHDLQDEDVVQEAYARLASMKSVSEIRNPRNYLYQIARTIVLAHVRRSKVVSIHSVADVAEIRDAGEHANPEIEASDRQQLARLAAAIAELDEPLRSAFQLRIIEDLPFKSIGEELGVSANAAQKLFSRSIKFLVSRIGGQAAAEPPSRGAHVLSGMNECR